MSNGKTSYVGEESRDKILRGLAKVDMTQKQLAGEMDISPEHLNKMLRGKLPMAKVYLLAAQAVLITRAQRKALAERLAQKARHAEKDVPPSETAEGSVHA